ncbi:saccharopine dehydrogenase family protein [uncultured Hymenobacter sp.]|uniref:saccharopine dehydrogenase family protein n=1 Tax=uncultured Hymenobacter sp. TaxID=170016 RepID=UPI0035CC6A5C
MNDTFLLYGATGYTGELLAREAVRRGLRPILAGRNAAAVRALAEALDLPWRACALDDAARLDTVLGEVACVLHAAGPFAHTSAPMVAACLRTGCHYLDITGEIDVFEALAGHDAAARAAGILLLPGVGFDVVPSDCLARHLKDRLPTANRLTLAFRGLGVGISHGTQATMLLGAGAGGTVRRNGALIPTPPAWKTRHIDFGSGPKLAVTIPWGDVATAFYSTGIPDVEVFMAASPSAVALLRASRYAGGLLSSGPVQRFLQGRIPAGGPDATQRAQGRTQLYGEVSDKQGRRVAARLSGPEGYTLTVLAALHITEKVLRGDYQPGFQTPARCYGAGLVRELPGVKGFEEVEGVGKRPSS